MKTEYCFNELLMNGNITLSNTVGCWSEVIDVVIVLFIALLPILIFYLFYKAIMREGNNKQQK